MRFHTILIIFLLLVSSCKNNSQPAEAEENQSAVEEGLVTMQGDFIYYEGAAVLQTRHTIYGVVLDNMAEELNRKVGPYKKSETDMVTVTLKGKRIPKAEGEDAWPFSIEIKEIIKIEQPEPGAQEVIELPR